MTTYKNLRNEFPFNLAYDVFCEEVYKIYLPNVLSVLATLTPREHDVLVDRYINKLTYEQIAKSYGITRERIRQIVAKTLRKLRHPTRANALVSVSKTDFLDLQKKYEQLRREYALLNTALATYTEKEELTTEDLITLNTPIINLDFSVRTFNCLARAGTKTLGDISKMTLEELQKVRNLGRKCCEEVIYTLKKYGLELRG
jgi:DNA-binding CsgD family transcriptional regulator